MGEAQRAADEVREVMVMEVRISESLVLLLRILSGVILTSERSHWSFCKERCYTVSYLFTRSLQLLH